MKRINKTILKKSMFTFIDVLIYLIDYPLPLPSYCTKILLISENPRLKKRRFESQKPSVVLS